MNTLMQRCARLLALLLLGTSVPANAAAIVVSDDSEHSLQLAAPAQRIITLAPFLTELVFAAGGGARLAGVSEYSDHPPAATKIRTVASAAAIDVESIVALQPDLVLAWRSGNGSAIIQRLRQLGLMVYVSEPRQPQDIVRTIRALGQLLGTAAQTDSVVQRFEASIDDLSSRYGARAPVTVFYMISSRPLMTLNGKHIVSAALRICGGINIFAELRPLAPTIDREAIVQRQPQLILVDSSIPQAEQVRQRWREFGPTAAARRGHVYIVDAAVVTRPTPRYVQGVRQLCEFIDRAR